MVRLEAALLACTAATPLSVYAFSTHQTASRGLHPSSRDHRGRFRRSSGGVVVLSSEPAPPRSFLLEDEPPTPSSSSPNNDGDVSPILDQNMMVESVIGNSADLGEDMFLLNLENTTPDMILSEEPQSLEPKIASMDIDYSNKPAVEAPNTIYSYAGNGTETDQLQQQSSSVLGMSEEMTTRQQQGISENVEAVLAASEDAMMLAEAALPTEVKEELGSFAANDSDIISPISTPLDEPVAVVPVAAVVGEPATSEITTPPVMKILKFAIPAIGVWLCSPLLSLIDTSAVGVLSGTIEQAALNPAVAVTDYAALLIAFLYTATTNLIASAEESDRTLPGKPKTTAAMLGAMQLSSYVGLALGSALFVFARPLLRAIIGNDAINPAVFAAAMKYVRIRALGMPAAAIIGSAQAGALGAKDTTTPLKVLGAAALVNFLGDVCFVGCKHPLVGGAAGAAWATVFSQYAALALFVRWLTKKPKAGNTAPKVVDLTKNIMDFMGRPKGGKKGNNKLQEMLESDEMDLQQQTQQQKASPERVASNRKRSKGLFGRFQKWKESRVAVSDDAGNSKDEAPSVRGLLQGSMRRFDLLKLPPRSVANEFKPYVIPVSVTQVGRVSGYVAMSHVVSSSLGTVSMAAQQVIVSFFYCLCPIADSLSLTAQSFLPGISERKPSKERANALRKTGMNFMKAGGVFGAVMAAMIGLLPILSGFFTSDPMVVSLVNMVVPLLVAFFSVHGVMCASEGVLLGQKDLGFLGKSYAAYFFAVPFFMLRVKRAALSGMKGINLSSVWTVFLGYQMFRLLAWVARVEIIQRRTDRAAPALEDSM